MNYVLGIPLLLAALVMKVIHVTLNVIVFAQLVVITLFGLGVFYLAYKALTYVSDSSATAFLIFLPFLIGGFVMSHFDD